MKNFLIIFFITLVTLAVASCGSKKQSVAGKDEYYTCSMHPQVMQDRPGDCPICHMKLIVAKKTNTAADEILLNDEQIRLGNILSDTVRTGTVGNELVLTATLSTDETDITSVNARVSGRVDRLYFKSPGDYVPQGAHLYDLYSEELNNARQEYVVAVEKRRELDNTVMDFDRVVTSAENKLLLWGMTKAQINELAKTGKVMPLTSFYSQASGYITELPVTEGQYVPEGGTILKLAGLSSLWAEAQVYASQLSMIDPGGTAVVRIPDIPGKEWTGRISFADPEIASGSRINLVRVTVPNANGILRPGMPAYVTIKNREVNAITLPIDAVLRDGNMNTVWVRTGKNRFRMRMVMTGLESDERIEIKSGLEDGDVVVTHGAYLLESEYVFKKGGNAMGGMKM